MTDEQAEAEAAAGEHRRLRELLGSFALDGLPTESADAVRAHLDGCPSCRSELAEIAPLAADLRTVEVSRLTDVPQPPADLGARIRETVAQERQLADAREAKAARMALRAGRRRSLQGVAAGVAVLLVGVGVGLGVGLAQDRDRSPAAPLAGPTGSPSSSPSSPPPAVPVEQLSLERTTASSPQVQSAGLIAHTWGVEVRLVGTGFDQGGVYRAAFRTRDGQLLPAGEFLGTGEQKITCNLQAALLRPDTEAFVVMDAAGVPVLSATLA